MEGSVFLPVRPKTKRRRAGDRAGWQACSMVLEALLLERVRARTRAMLAPSILFVFVVVCPPSPRRRRHRRPFRNLARSLVPLVVVLLLL